MSARIWLSVFLGVLAGAASAYRLYGSFWHLGVLAGIAIGVAVAWIALAPVGFWREFVRQLAKLDESFRQWRETVAARKHDIATMRDTWIRNIPDVVEILAIDSARAMALVTVYNGIAIQVIFLFITLTTHPLAASHLSIVIAVTQVAAFALATILTAAMVSLTDGYPRKSKAVPSYWPHWSTKEEERFRERYPIAIRLVAQGQDYRVIMRKFWLWWPVYALGGAWATHITWPALKWLWPRGPIALKALGTAFRYTHSEAHRHVATHTALSIAIGVWGFNAPVLPLALASATVSVAVWHAVSKRVFQAA